MDLVLDYEDKKIRMAGDKVNPLFNCKDLCRVLHISDYRQCIKSLDSDDKVSGVYCTLPSGKRIAMTFATESGFYNIVMRSRTDQAKQFKRWVCSEVLPSIRKYGMYPSPYNNAPVNTNRTINIKTENDLHYQVVKYIKNQLNSPFCMIVGLGELQDTPEKRIEASKKGYRPGLPDILISSSNGRYNGIALELKTPLGTNELSDAQKKTLNELENDNYKVIISNDYNDIIYKLTKYKMDMDKHENKGKRICPKCDKIYKIKRYYINHLEKCL
jgi:prophage antirepressor-like protein